MTVWRLRKEDEGEPKYLPNSEYFTIHWHTLDVDGRGRPRVCDIGWIDFCSSDCISRLEIDLMAKDLGLVAEENEMFWKHPQQSREDGLRSLTTDSDTIQMAEIVDASRVMHLYARNKIEIQTEVELQDVDHVEARGHDSGFNVEVQKINEHPQQMGVQIEDIDSEIQVRGQADEEGSEYENESDHDQQESDFVDSDYDLNDDDVEDDQLFDKFIDMELERDMSKVASDAIPNDEDVDSEQTVYAASDELVTASDDDSDGDSRKHRWPIFNEETDMANPQLKLGMLFSSYKQFKDAVKSASIKSRNQVVFGPNTKEKCKAKCKKKCDFFIWAYWKTGDKSSVQIKSTNFEHTCSKENYNRHVNAKFIAMLYVERFRADPTWSICGIIQTVKEDFQINVNRMKAWRARSIALKYIDGDEKDQLARLHDYKLELLRSNPGSTVVFDLEEQVFKGMYVCLAALREGVKSCRHVISIDGCWLKGIYGGQLLSAVGIDANDCIYPFAWAIVPKENKVYWKWFLTLLGEDLGINNDIGWVFMSDRQKGLIPAMEEIYPNSEHRFCVRHVHSNFKKKFNRLGLKELVWGAARSSYVQVFQKIMDLLAKESKEAHNYLNSIPAHHWSRSHFRIGFKCDMLLNNLCESFNNFILESRTKGVITMNEIIRTKLMKRIHTKRDAMKRIAGEYCPKIITKLEKSKDFCWMYRTVWSGGDRFQVSGPGGQFVVDTKERSCTCRRWDLTGIPCCHAVCAIQYNNEYAEKYLDDCFRVSRYLEIYNHLINPTTSKEFWPKATAPPVLPPEPVRPKKGRPPSKRRLEDEELEALIKNGKVRKKGSVMTCTICGAKGHNKRFHGAAKNPVQERRKKATAKKSAKKQSTAVNHESVHVTSSQNQQRNMQSASHPEEWLFQNDVTNLWEEQDITQRTISTFGGLSPIIPSSEMFNLTPTPTTQREVQLPSNMVDLRDFARRLTQQEEPSTSRMPRNMRSISDLLKELPGFKSTNGTGSQQEGRSQKKQKITQRGKKAFKPVNASLQVKITGSSQKLAKPLKPPTTVAEKGKSKIKDAASEKKEKPWLPPSTYEAPDKSGRFGKTY